MKLASVKGGQVVRNSNNGSYYRFERMENQRARIWSLELFPNGMLISKPTPTTIDADTQVTVVGAWIDGMLVEGKPDHSRRVYENELVRLERALPELEIAYEALPKAGIGKKSRGSWANKVKNTRQRIATLKRGLGFVDAGQVMHAQVEEAPLDLELHALVQVPSGRAGQVIGFQPMGDQTYVQVKTMFNGAALEAALPCEVLRPWSEARLCTV